MIARVEQRPFGSTGKNVGVISLGTTKFGRNTHVKYPGGDGFALPTDADIEHIFDLALAHGVNLIDTAPAYGVAEERIGQLLKHRRDDFFIVTKTGEEYDGEKSEYIFTAEHTRMSVARSLKRLKRNVLDCVLVHANRDDLDVVNNTPVMETLARLKDAGDIKSFGLSCQSAAGGRAALDVCDAVMVSFNPAYMDELPVIERARQTGAAVLIKKGLSSGHAAAAGAVADSIRFVTATAGVTSLVIGSINPANISSNINALING